MSVHHAFEAVTEDGAHKVRLHHFSLSCDTITDAEQLATDLNRAVTHGWAASAEDPLFAEGAFARLPVYAVGSAPRTRVAFGLGFVFGIVATLLVLSALAGG